MIEGHETWNNYIMPNGSQCESITFYDPRKKTVVLTIKRGYLEHSDGIYTNPVLSLDIPAPAKATKKDLSRMVSHYVPAKRWKGARAASELMIPTSIVRVVMGAEQVESGESSRVYYRRYVIEALGTIKQYLGALPNGAYSWGLVAIGEICERARERSEVTAWGAEVLKTWEELKSIGIQMHTYEVEILLKHYTLEIRKP